MTKPGLFRYFKTSPEIIRLAVMLYFRYPLSLRNVEDLLHERGIEISYETVGFWWHRFGPLFASDIRKRCVEGIRSSSWRWRQMHACPQYRAPIYFKGLARREGSTAVAFPPPLALENCVSVPSFARKLLLFSRVIANWLSTGSGPAQPQDALCGPILSEADDCAFLVFSLQSIEKTGISGLAIWVSIWVAFAH
jgi:hypothetical protein